MDNRICLKAGDRLVLARDAENKAAEEFLIISVIGKGSSSICYEALRTRDSHRGCLKEFYPVTGYQMVRHENVLFASGRSRGFQKRRDTYESTYRRISALARENSVIRNYVQEGELLFGTFDGFLHTVFAPKDQCGTVYHFVSGNAGLSFHDYIDRIYQSGMDHADQTIDEILAVIITLADFVRALHKEGILHLDLTPDNFLVTYDSYQKINPHAISVFDINSILDTNGTDVLKYKGTPGYRSPELVQGKPCLQSDLYSLGAVLYHALCGKKFTGDTAIADDFASSPLVQASFMQEDAVLCRKLVRILETCLETDPEKRYGSVSALQKELKGVKARLLVYSVSARELGHSRILKLASLREKGEAAPLTLMRRLLFEHPLFETWNRREQTVKVLALGDSVYTEAFLDAVMQAGQIPGRELDLTVLAAQAMDFKEHYLAQRKPLERFFAVDQETTLPQQYGLLKFEEPQEIFHAGIKAAQADHLAEAILSRKSYDYIFVSLSSDSLNLTAAKAFAAHSSCPVCFIAEKPHRLPKDSTLVPVMIHEPVTVRSIHPALEQMAFNTDMSWNAEMTFDLSEAYQRFAADPYNYQSSLAFALSVRYKLYAAGIVLAEDAEKLADKEDLVIAQDEVQAARLFAEKVLKDPDSDLYKNLVCFEHRRWVIGMITDGYDVPRDENGNMDLKRCISEGTVKNKEAKTHPCIQFSTPETPLNTPAYTENGRKKWDEKKIDPSLDELDRMSLRLHQLFAKAARNFRQTNPLHMQDLKILEEICRKDGAEAAYRQYVFCLRNILNGMEGYTRQYRYYEDVLRKELKKESQAAEERLKLIRKAFYPVFEAGMYRNYKAIDEELIRRIPFILSYRGTEEIAMAFEDGRKENGRNEAVYANVASASLLHPVKIHYFYVYDHDTVTGMLVHRMSSVMNYLSRRRCCRSVTFTIAVKDETQQKELQESINQLGVAKDPMIENIMVQVCPDHPQAMAFLAGRMGDPDVYDGSTSLFHSVYEDMQWVQTIRNRNLPYCEFDSHRKEFTVHEGCDALTFVNDRSFIRIHDMFALMNASDCRFNIPQFADDYEELWKIYTGSYLASRQFENGINTWNKLCVMLEKYDQNQKPVASFTVPTSDNIAWKQDVVLAASSRPKLEEIVNELIAYGVLNRKTSVESFGEDDVIVHLHSCTGYQKELEKLFDTNRMHEGLQVEKIAYPGETVVQVTTERLKVSRLDLDPNHFNRYDFFLKLLEALQEAHAIRSLKQDDTQPSLVSFVYTAPRFKKLLTSAGEILEVYSYYEALKTGYFDDAASGYEFAWEEGGVRNELDLVLTKGSRSMIIECKATLELKLDYYHKLHSIAEHFGIGTVKVLIGNTHERADSDYAENNAMQRSRGEQLMIRTISSQDEINNIGRTLVSIMEEVIGR